jgi:hypothetical protein
MNANDIAHQVLRMKGLMPEVNRTLVADRFINLITESVKQVQGDDSEVTLTWINEGREGFRNACQLVAPRKPVDVNARAKSSLVAQLIDKWESVDTWRVNGTKEWGPMSQETINIKAAMLTDLRKLIDAERKTPGDEPEPDQS